ncbi:MAG: amidohydrolase family protein [Actinomycetota bacterium]|nr:amidohydrolase family protein [Actinomycetota bacterium]
MSLTTSTLELIDHHCHGVVRGDLEPAAFEALLSEGGAAPAGTSNFDTPAGLAVRRHCAPVLDLEPHAPAEAYLARRAELGTEEVTHRLMAAALTRLFLVDAGFRGRELLSPAELGAAAGGRAREIVRLESVAESLAAGDGIDAGGFADCYANALGTAVLTTRAVGVKSVAAYRIGLDFDPAAPARQEVKVAADRWLERGPGAHGWRLDDPVLIRALLWSAVEVGLPIQFHTGFGDRDLTLHRANPLLLTDFIRAVPERLPIMLLHCYPYHREAGYLAAAYPQVYVDVGLALNFVGPSRAGAVLAEALELTPFAKMLYSSDAFGLPELYHLSAVVFRRTLSRLLDDRVQAGEWSATDAARIAHMIGSGNAERAYALGAV